jgi:hypothetical protein
MPPPKFEIFLLLPVLVQRTEVMADDVVGKRADFAGQGGGYISLGAPRAEALVDTVRDETGKAADQPAGDRPRYLVLRSASE